ncbi:MAG TPA: copper chaperone PCu(A)C [Acidocella sp.]|nr:copper chaperone PCu(A)C [Acidocella sp.]
MRGILKLVLAAGVAVLPQAAQAAAPAGVVAVKPWVRYLLPNIPAAGYMQLRNDGAADVVLTGAASPACGSLMLHKSEDKSGMAMMMAVPSITIPAHGSVTFAPGGYHLMCMKPKMKVGDKVVMRLSFQGGDGLDVPLPVYGASGAP